MHNSAFLLKFLLTMLLSEETTEVLFLDLVADLFRATSPPLINEFGNLIIISEISHEHPYRKSHCEIA